MCGRTAWYVFDHFLQLSSMGCLFIFICSTLAPDDVQKACCYKNPKTKKYEKPPWRDVSNGGRSYRPSHNVCPTDITPVIVSGSHFNMEESRVVQPMMWNLIPPWHKVNHYYSSFLLFK